MKFCVLIVLTFSFKIVFSLEKVEKKKFDLMFKILCHHAWSMGLCLVIVLTVIWLVFFVERHDWAEYRKHRA